MSETSNMGFPEAARRLGVPIRVLRRAIRAGRIPAPPDTTATAVLPTAWLDSAQAAYDAAPNALNRAWRQRTAPFARYEGTSAWRKYTNRVREYARFRALMKQTGQDAATPGA